MPGPSPRSRRLTALIALFVALTVFGVIAYIKSKEPVAIQATTTEIESLTLDDFAQKVLSSDQVMILDVRSKTDYITSHIPNSVSIPSYELGTRTDELELFRDWEIIIVCNSTDCQEIAAAVRTLKTNGFEKLFFLEGGFAAYAAADLSTASQAQLIQDDLLSILKSISVPEISVDEFKKLSKGSVTLLDVRTPYEFVTGFIPEATNIPLHAMSESIAQGLVTKDKPIIVYDRVGNRSEIAAQSLLDAGFSDVKSLTGGIEAWKESGGELELVAADSAEFQQRIPVLEVNKTEE